MTVEAQLRIDSINCFYGDVQVLHDLSFELEKGEVHCLFGRNGAGKTTTLRAIMGQAPVRSGRIVKDGVEINRLPPHRIAHQGIAYVPQGRRLFGELTVAENLQIGLMASNRGEETRERVLDLFPILRERLDQRSSTLSGGEQQQLAMARALCVEPDVLLLDEPTEGLMPSMIARIREVITSLHRRGVSTILVEQRVEAVLEIADRVSFIENGRLVATMPVDKLRAEPELIRKYVGVG
ncbi:ABC transporter ATP-binding protein [Chelativorans composti]|uniref:ABC transporter ATP-binding protein n=1 Tax=Chelativorans composti TaxID=768533 RepID=A0ABW5DDQ6_9HYPH